MKQITITVDQEKYEAALHALENAGLLISDFMAGYEGDDDPQKVEIESDFNEAFFYLKSLIPETNSNKD